MRAPDRPLVIPSWVPASVTAEARRLHAVYAGGNTAQRVLATTIERLATDRRMRSVWGKSCVVASPERTQFRLFRFMIAFAFWPAVPQRDIDKARDKAADLRADARKHGLAILESAAVAYDQLAADQRGAVIVARTTGDLAARAFAVRMTAVCRVLFGPERLSGTIAKMANVAFARRNISARAVRDWVKENDG